MENRETETGREREINLLDFFIFLARNKKIIGGLTLAAALISAVVVLVIPEIYRAEARIYAPPQAGNGLASQFLSQVTGSLTGLTGALGSTGENDLYVGMLQSRTVLDRVIDRFKLKQLYEVDSFQDAREVLKGRLVAMADPKSGIIFVSVEDRDPRRASEMTNAFIEELTTLTQGLAVTEAGQRRAFFEGQLTATKTALTRAEEEMKSFQERTGLLQVDSQAKAIIEGIAELRAQIAAKEVELKVMRTFATSRNPDLQKAEEALRGLKAELAKLEAKNGRGPDPLMPTGSIPGAGTEYVRKMRDLKFHETLYELLLKQFEVAKLDEVRNAVVIQVIDRAAPPEKRVWPKRTLTVSLVAFAALLLSIGVAFIRERLGQAMKMPENAQRLSALRGLLRFSKRRGKDGSIQG